MCDCERGVGREDEGPQGERRADRADEDGLQAREDSGSPGTETVACTAGSRAHDHPVPLVNTVFFAFVFLYQKYAYQDCNINVM